MSILDVARSKLTIISETNTEYRFRCPLCGGNNLKLNKRTGAYKCFTGYCDNNGIRSHLGLNSGYKGDYRAISVANIIKPVTTTAKFKPIKCANYEPAKKRILGGRTITHYIYNEKTQVERVDYYGGERKKECYPKYLSGNVWKYGASPEFTLFNSRYIGKDSGLVLMAEGEKTADTLTYFSNYLTLSPPPFGWNEDYISRNLLNPNIQAVLYLPDYDEAGNKKAGIVQRACWMVNIPCLIFKYDNLSMNDGEDVVDLIERDINVKELIDEFIR